MKKKNNEVTRREFLNKGATLAGVSIIAINSSNPTVVEAAEISENQMLANVRVFTEETQTLTNKTISSKENILGTDYVNVREFGIGLSGDNNITDSLNDAINYLASSNPPGGQILIPRGIWVSKGNHEISDSISIEGAGYNLNPGYGGTEIHLSGANKALFLLHTDRRNCSLKNLAINMGNQSNTIGILMTDNQTNGGLIYHTNIENVGFHGGTFGIKVESQTLSGFECILNRFERLSFLGCRTAFYCNSINGGYSFDNCYFILPPRVDPTSSLPDGIPPGVGLDCITVGNLSAEHCLFVGTSVTANHVPPIDGTTILRTTGAFNNISFHDCQDENIQYYYQNSSNHWLVPIVFRNCLIQSSFSFSASGSVVFDSCRINVTKSGTNKSITGIIDSANGGADVHIKGATTLFTNLIGTSTTFNGFTHPFSRLLYESLETGLPVINPAPVAPGIYGIDNATRGIVSLVTGISEVTIVHNRVTVDSIVFAQLREIDPGTTRISYVRCFPGYFKIHLNQNTSTTLSVAFKIES